jgi:Icc protein
VTRLLQLSDLHIGAEWGGGDPSARLAAAVASARAFDPDAVLITGDLADHGTDAEYEELQALLAPLAVPQLVLPGSHDAREALHRHFGVPGAGGEPVQYATDVGDLRVVVLDTTRPGEDDGALDSDRLAWLDATLAAAPDRPTVIAMHHPPLVSGVPALDAMGLAAADRRALAALVARHAQVRRLVAGHLHRTIAGDLGGRAVLAAPSTHVQALLTLDSDALAFGDEPVGFVVHVLRDGELSSHVQPVG